jgi:4-amino-4-deoxy-L-arabinose transferase-like glycosyltransferase
MGLRSERLRSWLAVLAIVALAAALRLYDLGDVPAGFFCDEAANGYNAWALATAGIDENGSRWPLYIWSFEVSYKNPVFIYSAIVPVSLLGLGELSVRLTAALYGIGTVAALYALGRLLFGARVGWWAALLLAVCPWHLHFSRIAFELIAFPCLFVVGFVQLARFTRGARTLPAAALFLAFCLYAYAIAALFVPLFVLGFAVLYAPDLVRRWRQTLLAAAVAVAALAPAALFFLRASEAGTQYFRATTYLDPAAAWLPQLERFASYYAEFFSPSFLFFHGDPLPRHAVPGFGELYPFFLPFLFIGAAAALGRGRAGWLLLWWLLLYPVGPSLMTEIPSASRSIIGAPAFCLLAGLGIATLLGALEGVFAAPRAKRVAALAAVAVAVALLGREAAVYLRAYFVDYAKYAAAGTHGFQYGYRDVIRYMESRRPDYEQLILTRTDANQPQIFPLFYARVDPWRWSRDRWTGYEMVYADLVTSYSLERRTLFAVLPAEVSLFQEYDVERRIENPDGTQAFVVIAPRAVKRFIDGWLALGPFASPDNSGIERDFVDVRNLHRGPYPGAFGDVFWKPVHQLTVRVDLNHFYAAADRASPGNPEWVCAYTATSVSSPEARGAFLEVAGSWDDTFEAWLNGRSLTPWPLVFTDAALRRPIELRAGENALIVKTCESISWWNFTVRITDAEGRDLGGVRSVPRLPAPGTEPRPSATPVQAVEGFAAVVGSEPAEDDYPDYRGAATAWRASVEGPTEVAWQTAPAAAKARAVFGFTASTSDEVADFDLFVGGRHALTFQSGPAGRPRSWQRGDYRLTFASRLSIGGNSGVALLGVPEEVVEPGAPLELRVRPHGGDPSGWFMIKAYVDTLAHEGIDGEAAEEAVFHPWEEVR